jgi:hypothetical protein
MLPASSMLPPTSVEPAASLRQPATSVQSQVDTVQPGSNRSNRRTLWLHIGAARTGTSALQSGLAINRPTLVAEHGLYYPESITDEAALRGETTSGNAEPLKYYLPDKHGEMEPERLEKRRQVARERAFRSIADALERHATATAVVFSSEFMGRAKNHTVSELASFVATTGWKLRIIYYVRHLVDHAIAGSIRRARSFTHPERFASYRAPFKDYIASYEDVLGKESIKVMVYDEQREDILGSFVATIVGQRPAHLVRPARVNQTLAGAELVVFQRLARELGTFSKRRQIKNHKLEDLIRQARTGPGDAPQHQPFVIEPAELEQIRLNNADILDHFNQTYFDGAERLKLKSDSVMVGQRTSMPIDEQAIDELERKIRKRLSRRQTQARFSDLSTL